VKITLFSLEDANRAIAEIRPELVELVELKRQLERIQSRHEVLELAISGASEENPDARELRALAARRKTLGERLRRGLEQIHRRGCLIKDLDRGLVDFYALAGDRLVFLCWQLGEDEVGHWHTLDSGFAGRQRVHPSELE
jgi:hypothetical protein